LNKSSNESNEGEIKLNEFANNPQIKSNESLIKSNGTVAEITNESNQRRSKAST
jgi:hypothetical protein